MIYFTRTRPGLGHNETAALVKRAVLAALREENITEECTLDVTLTDDETIHGINLEHRGVDRPTDVLSFPLNELIPGEFDPENCERDPETGEIFLGDMVISIPRCEAQGEEYTLTTDIAEGAELKVVKAKGENIVTWYPEGEDNNCTVNQAGNYTVYFRPNADGGDDWFNKVIYLNRNGEPVGIDAVNAIGENTVIFTLAGQRVKNAQKGIFIQNGKKVVIK